MFRLVNCESWLWNTDMTKGPQRQLLCYITLYGSLKENNGEKNNKWINKKSLREGETDGVRWKVKAERKQAWYLCRPWPPSSADACSSQTGR